MFTSVSHVCAQIVMSHVAQCAVEHHRVVTSSISALTSESGATAAQTVMTPATRHSAIQVVSPVIRSKVVRAWSQKS